MSRHPDHGRGRGKKGSGLVQVSKENGKEVARCWLGDKTPEYEMDEIDGRVFFMKSEKETLCHPFGAKKPDTAATP